MGINFDLSESSKKIKLLGVFLVVGLMMFSLWVGIGFLVDNPDEIDRKTNPFYSGEAEVVPDGSEDFIISSSDVEGDTKFRAEVKYDSDENVGVMKRIYDNKRTVLYFEGDSNMENITMYMRYDMYKEDLDSSAYSLNTVNTDALGHGSFDEAEETCLRNDSATQFSSGSEYDSVSDVVVPVLVVPNSVAVTPLAQTSENTYEFKGGFVESYLAVPERVVYMSSDGELQFEDGVLTDSTVEYSVRTIEGERVGPFTFVTDISSPDSSEFNYSLSYEEVSVEKPNWIEESGCY